MGRAQFASESVLRQGSWYQVAVTETGVYRIDASLLLSLGLDPSTIDARTLRLFGRTGAPVPQANNAPRVDDLQELPLYPMGSEDGVLTGTDALLFYAEGPLSWRWDSTAGRWRHQLHPYSDTTYYYLTFEQGLGLRMLTQAAGDTSQPELSTALALWAEEQESTNLLQSGRLWLGQALAEAGNSISGPALNTTQGTARFYWRVAARSAGVSTVGISANASLLGQSVLSFVNLADSEGRQAWLAEGNAMVAQSTLGLGALAFTITHARPAGSLGWLDYLEAHVQQSLVLTDDTHRFYLDSLAGARKLALSNPGGYLVWDVSEPLFPLLQEGLTDATGRFAFQAIAGTGQQFVAFRPAATPQPIALGAVANQNLHADAPVDYLIIAAPAHQQAAEQLAQLHSQAFGRSTRVVSSEQIYHEFSAGRPEPAALRDYIRMLWVRSGGMAPSYVLLMGDGQVNGRAIDRSVQLPTYQSRESLVATNSYVSDDFYALLESNEGFWGEGSGLTEDTPLEQASMDLAVGRLPARDATEAQIIVSKIASYLTAGAGPWQQKVLWVGDYRLGEGFIHTGQADSLARHVRQRNADASFRKLYIDRLPASFTGGQVLFPQAEAALLQELQSGSVLVNYTGHGSNVALSNSRILELAEIAQLNNSPRLPFWVTATCEFGRYDLPEETCGAQALLFSERGGAVGILSSVRLVFSFPNFAFNRNWLDYPLTQQPDGSYPTVGEALRLAKNGTYGSAPINTRSFALLADPGLPLQLPRLKTVITTLNGQPLVASDTLKGLAQLTLTGEVQDAQGNPQPSFSGRVRLRVLDQGQTLRTLISEMPYQDFPFRLFEGWVEVTNGSFEFSFTLPRDLAPGAGVGRLELFALSADSSRTAYGAQNQAVGGLEAPAGNDAPPSIQLFLNDSSFVNGGLVGPNPTLLARLSDDRGFNLSTAGVGHEMLLIIDGDEANAVVLNDLYEPAPGDFTQGSLSYQLNGLSPGPHTLSLRVWDVANQPATASLDFRVAESTLEMGEIVVFPNPTQGPIGLRVSHNRAGRPLELRVEIIASGGQLAGTYSQTYTSAPTTLQLEIPSIGLAAGTQTVRVRLTDGSTGENVTGTRKVILQR